jgi:hypothetical protein
MLCSSLKGQKSSKFLFHAAYYQTKYTFQHRLSSRENYMMSVFFDVNFRSVVNVDDPAGDRAEREADGLVRRLRKEVGGPKLALPSQVRHFENILLSELN